MLRSGDATGFAIAAVFWRRVAGLSASGFLRIDLSVERIEGQATFAKWAQECCRQRQKVQRLCERIWVDRKEVCFGRGF